MELGIAGKTSLVFGAGGGLGRAISIALAKEGCRVALADIDEDALEASANAVALSGGRVFKRRWDLADHATHPLHLLAVKDALGSVDILVNLSGGPPPTRATGVDLSQWLKQFHLMILSTISITDAVVPEMRKREWGRIITSTSSGVVAPIPDLTISNSLRSALVGWSKSLAREVAPHGITANVIVPGRIATDRIRHLDKSKADREKRDLASVVAESVAAIPAGRYGTPGEYADVVTFLASQRASYVTGSIVRVDGGYIPSI
jgi:3-oxoacyl-[acyl-carrier protein] reductase